MRTLLAAILLIVVITMAAVAASWLTGYVRIEFGDEPPRISAEHPAVIEPPASEPVADGPQEEATEPEVAAPVPAQERPPVRIVTPAGTPEEAAPSAPPAHGNAPPAEAPEMAAAPAPPPEPAQPVASPRVVGGPGITPGPFAAAEPLPREAVPAGPEPADWTTYRRVTIVGAGEIDLGKRRIVLAGLAPLPADRQCRVTKGAAEHPCATLALQALRQRVRGLGVQCRSGADSASADCRIGATDLSLWLIEQGWAEAASDAPEAYRAAESEARCAAKGLWRTAAPPADCPAR